MNSNILVEYKPTATVGTTGMLSAETEKFFRNKKISICDECDKYEGTRNLFEVSTIMCGEEYLGNSITGRHVFGGCPHEMTDEHATYLNKQIKKEEEANNLPYLQQEKLLAAGRRLLNKAKIASGSLWGRNIIENSALKLLENPSNNLEITHPGYMAAKYLYFQAHQHKVEHHMECGPIISLRSIDNHITNLTNSLHYIVENDDTKLKSWVAITANDFLNQNQEIKYLLGKLYILKAILTIQENPTRKNIFKDKVEQSLTYICEADNLITSEFFDLMKTYFVMLKKNTHGISSNLQQNLARYKLGIKQLESEIDNYLNGRKNITKYEYKNIQKQYLENHYAYFFTVLILTRVYIDKKNILNYSRNLYKSSRVDDQLFSRLQEYAKKQYRAISKLESEDQFFSD
jgi:hypothetical protein